MNKIIEHEIVEGDELDNKLHMLNDFFVINKITTRISAALMARLIYELYKEHCSKEIYFQFLDKCKKYWEEE